jgi:hypothetical protein
LEYLISVNVVGNMSRASTSTCWSCLSTDFF